jgi:polysaccharide biosynthesis protein PelB
MKHVLLVAVTALLTALLTALPIRYTEPCYAEDAVAPIGPRVPFDPELFALSYDVFLANSNPADAFLLAEKAVAAQPRDFVWHRKAAQSAEWSGNSFKALEHWFFLARETRQQDAIDNAFRLARALGDGSRLKLLLEQQGVKNNPALLREYVSVCEVAGVPDDAITALELHRGGAGRKYALEQLARLYEAVGRNKDAIAARLDLVKSFGVSGTELVKAASLAYGSGDMQLAYTILRMGGQLPGSESEYWKAYGDLAWALQDTLIAEKASRLLFESGVARETDFQRLIMVSREKYPERAYDLALAAWKRFGKEKYLSNLLELGITLKRYAELAVLIRDAEKSGALKSMEEAANFWTLVAQVYRGNGNVSASVRSYQRALGVSPSDGILAAGYIWWLLDLDQRGELRRTLQAWDGREKIMPELAEPFGSAYIYLGESIRALVYFKSIYEQKRNDPAWLAAYADALEQAGWPEAAFAERLRAMRLARKRMNTGTGAGSEDRRTFQLDYARLAMGLVPGDALDKMMLGIMRSPQDEVSRELIAAWALSTQRSDLARIWYWREFARMAQRPAWVELSQALEDNDRPRIAALLEHDPDRLASRDAIEGAQRAGWTPLAETHAFEQFQGNDRDHLLDRLVRELYGTHPGWFRYQVSLIEQDGVGFLDQKASLAVPVSHRFSLRLDADNIYIRAQKSDVLRAYPGTMRSVQAGVLMRHESGTAELMAGMRDGLSQHVMASLKGDWKIDSRLSLSANLNVGTPATESVPMQIAGLNDEAEVSLSNALTPSDTLMLKLSGRYLKDQERRNLGEGASFEGELTHRILADWPDINAKLFGGYYYYARTGTPSGKTLALIPPETPADASFFVPPTFYQAGMGLSIGQEGHNDYIRDWRPYVAADAIWNSESGFGYHYEFGLLGPVFGLDNLECAFSQDSGSFGRSETTTRFDLRYMYHF